MAAVRGTIGAVRDRLKRFALRPYQDFLALRSFVDAGLRCDPDTHWLLIFTLPNSGSTAFADLISQSARARRLASNNEGQWLLPELSRAPDRMLEKPLVSRRKLRAVWLQRLGREPSGPRVVVEKSPDNIFRWRHLSAALEPMPQTRVVLVREPLPTIASWARRYDIAAGAQRWGATFGIPPEGRENQLRVQAQMWLQRARLLLECRTEAQMFVRYEALCDDPARHVEALKRHVPALGDVDPAASLKVKDYAPQRLRNMNAENLRTLGESDIAVLRQELATDAAVVEALGYSL